jgi:hypothetical protein
MERLARQWLAREAGLTISDDNDKKGLAQLLKHRLGRLDEEGLEHLLFKTCSQGCSGW